MTPMRPTPTSRARWWIVWPICLSLWILALVPQHGVSLAMSAAAAAVCAALLMIPAVRMGPRLPVGRSASILAGFYLLGLIGTIASGKTAQAAHWALIMASIVLLANVTALATEAERTKAFRAIIGLALVNLLVVTSQTLQGSPALWGLLGDRVTAVIPGGNNLWDGFAGRAVGTLAHPIPTALLFCVAIILALGGAVRSRPAAVFIAAVLGVGVAMTGTRSAVVCLAAAGVFFLVQRGGLGRVSAFWKAIIIAVAAAAAILVNPDDLRLVTSLEGTVSWSHRVESWQVFWRLLEHDLRSGFFGYGVDRLTELSVQGVLQSDSLAFVDNSFVSVAVVSGLVGLALMLWFLVRGFRRADRVSRVALVFCLAMFLSFDVVLWAPCFALVVFLACAPTPAMEAAAHAKRTRYAAFR